MYQQRSKIYHVLILLMVAGLTACGGGGDSGSPPDNFNVSTKQLVFTADIDADTPATQIITGTMNSVTQSIRVDVIIEGTPITNATFSITGNNSGDLTVIPNLPSELGTGLHTGRITVYVCTDLSGCAGKPTTITGSPKVINVSYNVTATPTVRYVSPRYALPNTSDEVIIRGVGFSLLNSPTVSFGSTSALSISMVNDTEIRASFPPLAAGNYAVNVNDTTGAIATEATLDVFNEPAPGYAYIANSGEKTRLLYDAKRDAIYVGNKTSNELIRYTHSVDINTGNPVWAASTLAVTEINDIAFMPDGNTLVVLSGSYYSAYVIQINLETFTQTRSVLVPSLGSNTYLRQLGIANNGIGFVVPGFNGSGATFIYKYNARKNTINLISDTVSQGTVGTSGDGSSVFIGSRDSNTSFNKIYQYNATTDAALATLSMDETANAMPVDRTGNTLVLGFQNFLNDQRKVYQGSLLQGQIPGSSTWDINYATALAADGSTLYSYDPIAQVINIYDLTSPDGVGGFNQTISSPVSISDATGPILALSMELTPFGGTLFIAGNAGIVVQPLP